MDTFLNGLTAIVSNVIDAFVSGASKIFNILVVLDSTTGTITGLSVAGWFVVLGIGLSVVGGVLAFFGKLINKKMNGK